MITILGKVFISYLKSTNNRNLQYPRLSEKYTLLHGVLMKRATVKQRPREVAIWRIPSDTLLSYQMRNCSLKTKGNGISGHLKQKFPRNL